MIFLVQGDENFTVRGRNSRDVPLRDSGPAIGDSDVIDQGLDLIGGDNGTDFSFKSGEAYLCFLNTGAGWATGMEPHLAGINVGEKIFADECD